jgi:hypothetical protein
MGSKAKTKEPERCAGTFPGQVNMLQVSQQALQYLPQQQQMITKRKHSLIFLQNTWEKISGQIRATGKTKRLCNGRTKELHIWDREKTQSVQ